MQADSRPIIRLQNILWERTGFPQNTKFHHIVRMPLKARCVIFEPNKKKDLPGALPSEKTKIRLNKYTVGSQCLIFIHTFLIILL